MGERRERIRKLIEVGRQARAEELVLQERELAEQVFRLRFQLSSGQAEGLKKLREARRDLARVKTLLREARQRQAGESKGKSE
jgi:large subunit ribosomal protein L29